MLYNILANAAEKTRDVLISEAALYALLGFLIVFLGIAVLIFVVWLVGKFMTKASGSVKTEKKEEIRTETIVPPTVSSSENDLDEETVAVIMAAVMAYYQKDNPKCEFTVKRIKRI